MEFDNDLRRFVNDVEVRDDISLLIHDDTRALALGPIAGKTVPEQHGQFVLSDRADRPAGFNTDDRWLNRLGDNSVSADVLWELGELDTGHFGLRSGPASGDRKLNLLGYVRKQENPHDQQQKEQQRWEPTGRLCRLGAIGKWRARRYGVKPFVVHGVSQ
jgi:hypothetical protein